MMNRGHTKKYKKIAFVLSLCMMMGWLLLGAGASLAWFADQSGEMKNIFHVAEFDLEVSHRLPDGTWEKVDSQTGIFDEEALYEPGYAQVVFLKIENRGTVPFDFQTAVSVTDYTPAVNVFGQRFYLQDYLRFGLVTAATEEMLVELVSSRIRVREIAVRKLNNYAGEAAELTAGETVYMALMVYMPETVDDRANYRGGGVPKVELGIIVSAVQKKK
ncbi:MAG: hypothetical protein E7438_08455 [Ruminococcaceae bacterium]|nr:hypothetical protein [Oscillospiraceae bacterium]